MGQAALSQVGPFIQFLDPLVGFCRSLLQLLDGGVSLPRLLIEALEGFLQLLEFLVAQCSLLLPPERAGQIVVPPTTREVVEVL